MLLLDVLKLYCCSVFGMCDWRDMKSQCIMHSSGLTWTNTGLPGYCNKRIPVPRVLCHRLTEVTEVPGKGMGILQNFQKFRVRVRKSYRTHRSPGYCGTGVQNSQKFRAGMKCCTRTPGIFGTGVQSLQKIRVRVWMSYRAHRSSGYGYECPTELADEAPCRVIPGVKRPGVVLYAPYRTPC